MKRSLVMRMAMLLGWLLLPVAYTDAATPMPRALTVVCPTCGEEAAPLTPSAHPVVHFWFFYDSGCYTCLQVYNGVLPRLLANYPRDQVVMNVWDVSQFGTEVKRAMEQRYGITQGDSTEIFIGAYALLGKQEIEARLPGLIEAYLGKGGVGLVQPRAVQATLTPALHPSPTAVSAPSAVVRAIFFWSQYCPHCHEVIENVFPPLKKKYGAQLEIYLFELSQPENAQLFERTLVALNVPRNNWAVPFLIVGDQTLVGSFEIAQRLPGLIEKYLAAGGIGLPPIPELTKRIATPTPTAALVTTPTRTPTPTVRVVVNEMPLAATPAPTLVARASQPIVRATMFWMQGCPHCEEIIARVLPPLQQKYGAQLEVQLIQVVTQQDVDRLYQIAAKFKIPKEQTGVPLLVIGNQALTANQIPTELPRLIEKYLAMGGVDAPNLEVAPVKERHLLDLPFVGQIDLDQHSLAFSTLLIGLVDGFNPCSLWVISLLLALVVNTGSRRKTLLVGSTFLLVAAGIYALIIIGLFSMFTFIGYVWWIRLAVALLAGAMAAINIKDYFWFKRGVSLTIADEHKPTIYRGLRGLLAPNQSTFALVGATAALALGITIIEMPCTAGLPILWTKLIAANNVGGVMFALLLGLYMLMYVLDELLVFISAIVTLRATRLEEKQGRILKLVGGIVMLTLAIVLLVDPLLMDSLVNSMLVFGVAFLLALAILIVHRKILPRWGIVMGTEEL